jgi:hypothetical protein
MQSSGIQPGVRVHPWVREHFLRGTRKHLTGYVKIDKKYYFVMFNLTASVVRWSEFLATEPEARVRFPALPKKK